MITADDIRTVPLFTDLDDNQLRRIAARAADLRVRTGDWVAREGEPGAFYVVLEGAVEVTKTSFGREQQLVVRVPGDYFGEVPLLLDAPFMAGFRATLPSRLMRLSGAAGPGVS
jgi:thioredoxin reductase (NADPH)